MGWIHLCKHMAHSGVLVKEERPVAQISTFNSFEEAGAFTELSIFFYTACHTKREKYNTKATDQPGNLSEIRIEQNRKEMPFGLLIVLGNAFIQTEHEVNKHLSETTRIKYWYMT